MGSRQCRPPSLSGDRGEGTAGLPRPFSTILARWLVVKGVSTSRVRLQDLTRPRGGSTRGLVGPDPCPEVLPTYAASGVDQRTHQRLGRDHATAPIEREERSCTPVEGRSPHRRGVRMRREILSSTCATRSASHAREIGGLMEGRKPRRFLHGSDKHPGRESPSSWTGASAQTHRSCRSRNLDAAASSGDSGNSGEVYPVVVSSPWDAGMSSSRLSQASDSISARICSSRSVACSREPDGDGLRAGSRPERRRSQPTDGIPVECWGTGSQACEPLVFGQRRRHQHFLQQAGRRRAP